MRLLHRHRYLDTQTLVGVSVGNLWEVELASSIYYFLPTSCALSACCLKGRESFPWLSAVSYVTCHHMSQTLWSLIPFELLCQINPPIRGCGLGVFTTLIENYLFYFQIMFFRNVYITTMMLFRRGNNFKACSQNIPNESRRRHLMWHFQKTHLDLSISIFVFRQSSIKREIYMHLL